MTTPVSRPNLYALMSVEGDAVPENTPFTVSPEDRQSFDMLPPGRSELSVVVRDIDTGQHWRMWRESCGASCFCAARAELIPEGP
jgi:hypothetical protein